MGEGVCACAPSGSARLKPWGKPSVMDKGHGGGEES